MSTENTEIRISEIRKFIFSFSEEGRDFDFFNLDLNQIAKLILNKYFLDQPIRVCDEITDSDFQKIREEYICFCWKNVVNTSSYVYMHHAENGFDSFAGYIPTEKTLFFEHICKIWVGIRKSPCIEMRNLLRRALEDLQGIKKNIEICENEKKEWEKKSSASKSLYEAYHNLIDLYIERNKDAQGRIIEFLSSRQKMMNHIQELIADSYGVLGIVRLGIYQSISPYGFRYNESYERTCEPTYNFAYFSELRHKFLHLDLRSQKYKDLITPFYEKPDDLDERCLKYEEYINRYKITEEIESNLSHMRLKSRRQSILTCLKLYSNDGDLNAFIGLSAIQIEGCFGDFCKKIIDSNDRRHLDNKVDSIQGTNSLYGFEYEYFKYIFPARIRNQVVHGELIAPELLRFTSLLILLDLNCVVNILCRPVDEITWLGAELLGTKEPTPIQDIASICLLRSIKLKLENDKFRENWNLLLEEHHVSLDIERFLRDKAKYVAQKSPYWIKFRKLVSLAKEIGNPEKEEQNLRLAIESLGTNKFDELMEEFLKQLKHLKDDKKLKDELPEVSTVISQTVDDINSIQRKRKIGNHEKLSFKANSKDDIITCINKWKTFFELE
jgi:hypothetical protein